ncbi:hypothetical protein [Dankookia rubra]|nr:hypothetical protein [Dankookia rubra]
MALIILGVFAGDLSFDLCIGLVPMVVAVTLLQARRTVAAAPRPDPA